MIFQRTIQNVNRAKNIAIILIKYGFEEVVTNTPLKKVLGANIKNALLRHDSKYNDRSSEERIRMVIEELGATFIKLAQVVSNRPDIVSTKLMAEFEKLQNEVHPETFETIIKCIEDETRMNFKSTFSYIEKKPIGAASIGQVHRAILVNGQEVVVKVQRPNVAELVRRDLDIIKEIVHFGENYFHKQGLLNPMDIVEAFEKVMLKELDYRTEARNMVQFKKYYEDNDTFYVPKVYKDISTEKILIQEFVNGCKITDVLRLHQWNISTEKIVQRGMEIYMSQIFEHGFFHADPHPGNIIIQKDGRICLIDYGMVGKLNKRDKYNLAGIFIGMAQRDAQKTARSLVHLSLESDIKNIRKLEADISELIEEYVSLDVSEANIGELSNNLQAIIYEYKLLVPPSIFIILRSFTILEGIGKSIHPTFQFYEFLKPYGFKIIKERFSPGNIAQDLTTTAAQLLYFLRNLPYDAQDIITQVAKGRLNFQVEQHGHTEFLNKLDLIANRFIITFLIIGLLMSSAIMLQATFHSSLTTASGIPYFSVVGFIIAGFLFLLLIISIFRRGRL